MKPFFRTATQDYVLRGQPNTAGDALFMAYPSANRDEDVSEAPFAFRCDRQSGFGYGAHTCIGMVLAKIELQILLGEIVARVHSFELAGQPAWVETSFVGGLKRLPVPVVME